MRHGSLLVVLAGGSVILLGCKDLTGNQQSPAGTVNPVAYNTPAGAAGMRASMIGQLQTALPSYITDSGLLTDELTSNLLGAGAGAVLIGTLPPYGSLDARILPQPTTITGYGAGDIDYESLQTVRAYSSQALGAIAAYDTGATAVGDPHVMRGELFALEGYSEILLADFFCSGIPLSTLDFQRDFTYHAGSTTAEVYQDAVAKEDSAVALADTSTQVLNLARVLKARALLALDSVATATQIAAQVPTGFSYELSVNWINNLGSGQNLLNNVATVSDAEGTVGMPYISSQDPRTTVVNTFTNSYGFQLTFPARYTPAAFNPFVVGDWIEARLIQAEGAYRVHDVTTMLNLLNQLRQTATVFGQTATPVPGTLTDPGAALSGTAADSARIALIFQERAYWLFMTGHRQGDLRRLLREYSEWFQSANQVYPHGSYPAPAVGTTKYGTDITAPIAGTEFNNPLYHGCHDRNP